MHHTHVRSVLVPMFLAMAPLALAACADPASSPSGDDEPPPLEPAGDFELRSSWSLAAPPAKVGPVLAELAAATDGPDDPSRYVIDRMVARIDDPRLQALTAAVAPYLAAYVQSRIDEVAPRLADGTRALAAGIGRLAVRFDTRARLTVLDDGRARHTLTGFDLDGVGVTFGELGLADVTGELRVTLDGDRLALAPHAARVPYAALLRAGLDRAIVPSVVPGATSLDAALAALVDCGALGQAIADFLGLGAPELFARACAIGLSRVASELYARLELEPESLAIAGLARVSDLDRDGAIDEIAGGTWSGTFGGAPLGASTFEGRAP